MIQVCRTGDSRKTLHQHELDDDQDPQYDDETGARALV